jgi:hypothetical protein
MANSSAQKMTDKNTQCDAQITTRQQQLMANYDRSYANL